MSGEKVGGGGAKAEWQGRAGRRGRDRAGQSRAGQEGASVDWRTSRMGIGVGRSREGG